MKNGKWYAPLNLGRNLIMISLFLGATVLIYDDHHGNGASGWLMLIAFWMFKSLFDLIQNIQEGNKKTALLELLFVVVTASFLCWQGIENIV